MLHSGAHITLSLHGDGLVGKHNLDSDVEQTRMVAELLQRSDAGQVCAALCEALKAGSEDVVAEEVFVQLLLQRGRRAEQCPVQARWQVAVDDLLRPPQNEHAGETRELSSALFP